jgi:enoyl-CoA hydratase/carnithine racemase
MTIGFCQEGDGVMTEQVVRYSVKSRVAQIELDRPDHGNAMTLGLCTQLVEALDQADNDDDVGAVVLSGRGRHFCVGADLEQGFAHSGRGEDPRFEEFVARHGEIDGVPRDAGGVVTLRLAAMRTPVIGAVEGAAVGGGASMLLPADLRVVGRSARLGFVFTRRGMITESASSWFLPRLVGAARAMDWVMTGRLVEADELLASGLAARVVDDGTAVEAATALAQQIVATTSQVATSVSRQLLWSMLSAVSPWDAHRWESKGVFDLPAKPDVVEGVRSFLERREPQFPMTVPADYPDYGPQWPGPNPLP